MIERSEERKVKAKEEGRERMAKTMKPFSFVVCEVGGHSNLDQA